MLLLMKWAVFGAGGGGCAKIKAAMNMSQKRIWMHLRMPRVYSGLFLLALAALFSSAARAQTDINVNLYGTLPMSASKPAASSGGVVTDPGVNQTADPSLGFRMGLRHMFHPHFGLEVNWGYNRATQHFSGSSETDATVYSHAKPFTIDYVSRIKAYKGFQFFWLAGAGFVSYDISSYGPGGNTTGTITEPAQSEILPAGEYGVGADYHPHVLPKHIGLRLQYRAIVEHAPDYRLTYLSTNNLINISEPSVGITLKF